MQVDETAESTTAENQEVAPPEPIEAEAQAEKTEESAPSTAESQQGDETVPASEAAKPIREGESKAERRIKQLSAQVRQMERQLGSVTQARQPPPPREPVKPKIESYETVADYEAAMDKYAQECGDFRVHRSALERQQAELTRQAQKVEAEARSSWNKRVQSTVKRVEDFDFPKALQAVEPTPAMDSFLLESEIGPDLLWELYQDPEQSDRIRQLPPMGQVRELMKLETQLSNRIKGIRSQGPPPRPPKTVGDSGALPAAPKSAADLLYG
ncbi:MAG: hypothetical protein V1794_09135 [Candidatus Glassbacteria bacterium]